MTATATATATATVAEPKPRQARKPRQKTRDDVPCTAPQDWSGRLPLPLITFLASNTAQARQLAASSDLNRGRLTVAVPPMGPGWKKRGQYRICEAIISELAAEVGYNIDELLTQKSSHRVATTIAWLQARD